jgi:hypothetical protein
MTMLVPIAASVLSVPLLTSEKLAADNTASKPLIGMNGPMRIVVRRILRVPLK